MIATLAKTSPMPRERMISGESHGEEEVHFNYSLRPLRFAQYIGQALPDELIEAGRILTASQGDDVPGD